MQNHKRLWVAGATNSKYESSVGSSYKRSWGTCTLRAKLQKCRCFHTHYNFISQIQHLGSSDGQRLSQLSFLKKIFAVSCVVCESLNSLFCYKYFSFNVNWKLHFLSSNPKRQQLNLQPKQEVKRKLHQKQKRNRELRLKRKNSRKK